MSASVEDYLLWHWFGNVSPFFSSKRKYLNVILYLLTLPLNFSIKNAKKARFCVIAKISSSLFRFVKAKMKKNYILSSRKQMRAKLN